MAEEHKSQRTERPTDKRIRKARKEGQVARSQEVPGVLVLVGFLAYAHLFGAGWLERMMTMIVSFVEAGSRPELSGTDVAHLFRSTVISTGMLLAGPLLVVTSASVGGNLIQGSPTLSFKPFEPKFDKLNPIKGLKKIVSLKQWVEVLKSLLKMTLYCSVAYTAVRDIVFHSTIGTPGAGGTLELMFRMISTVLIRGAALAAGLALLDFLFRRYDHIRGLKMTKREIKDERKETEGDPLIRARIRQKQMAMSRSRMMADVPKATVVITNPEHFAVALRYVPGETAAPKLLAKGTALLAARIREIAREHKVPIHSDPPLARALYRSVPIGAEIPTALFRAVAEVLALVLEPRKRRGRRRPNEVTS